MRLSLFTILAALVLLLGLVHAQSPTDVPTDTTVPTDTAVPTDSATPTDSTVPTDTVSSTSTSASPVATTPAAPLPIFSNSSACAACEPSYAQVKTCSNLLPPSSNLTVITSVMPFYGCICTGATYPIIDALYQCSICLRSTGQQGNLHPSLYNVVQNDVRAFRTVCAETQNGTTVPNGSSFLHPQSLWSVSALVVAILVSTMGLLL